MYIVFQKKEAILIFDITSPPVEIFLQFYNFCSTLFRTYFCTVGFACRWIIDYRVPVSIIFQVIQKRSNGFEDFYRDWHDYKKGFGCLNGNYWLG